MDVEETKKIIQSKIEAEAATKNVRSKIKSYIHEKQNLREGFKETFKPLIKSQDKVKESIDNQQNAMIKQLQENQLALTQGLDKNRLAITQGFDEMDDVKKWDLQQLPGYEAIEEPEIIQHILTEGKEDEEDGDEEVTLTLPPREESKKRVNAEADRILKSLKLTLPSEIKNEKYEVIKKSLRDGERNLNIFKDKLANKANFKTKDGINIASPKNENPHTQTKREIEYYNVMGIYVNNLSKLEDYAKKKDRTRYFTF